MRVRELLISGFTAHSGESHVQLPDAGVVVVRGPNGAGKSSILEAVSVGGWGEPLRGADPWRAGEAGLVALTVTTSSGDVQLVRKRSATGKKTLQWMPVGGTSAQYETTTKAQEALTATIGEWDLWRRAFVFSSADAAQFSGATDSERKRILERMLGLAQYEAAAEAAGKEATSARLASSNAFSTCAVMNERLKAANTARAAAAEAAQHAKPTGKDPERLKLDLQRLTNAYDNAMDKARAHREQKRVAQAKVASLATMMNLEGQRLAKLTAAGGACPTCSQPLADAIALLNEHYEKLRAETEPELACAKTDLVTATREAELQEAEARTHQGALNEIRTQLRVREAQQAAFDNAQAIYQRAQDAYEPALDAARAAETAKDAAAEAQGVADQVVKVFGTKGVRAHILGRAMEGLSRAASHWLSKLSGGEIALEVKPYSEKKAGGLSDAISIAVSISGAPPRAYQSLSGGERRRVDVALLLGLSELAQASSGFPAGSTLFVDEAMDALDDEGVANACAVLGDLARDRCVVLITHNDRLVVPNAVMKLRVVDGRII